MRIARIKTNVQLKNFGQDNSKVFSKSNIISCNVCGIWKRLLDQLQSRILLTTFSVLIGNSFLDGFVSIGTLLFPGKMHNTDVKTTAVLKTLVLLKHFQLVLPKRLNGYPYTVCKQRCWEWPVCVSLGGADLSIRKVLGTLSLICFEIWSRSAVTVIISPLYI